MTQGSAALVIEKLSPHASSTAHHKLQWQLKYGNFHSQESLKALKNSAAAVMTFAHQSNIMRFVVNQTEMQVSPKYNEDKNHADIYINPGHFLQNFGNPIGCNCTAVKQQETQ